jgi:hypothetical protein
VNQTLKAFVVGTVVATAALSAFSRDASAAQCGSTIEHKKDPIPFKVFERKDPATGHVYLPNEEIEVTPGKKMLAKKYFDELDDSEAKLNRWGYTLRSGAPDQPLSEIEQCRDVMDKQYEIAKASSKEGDPLIDPAKWIDDLKKKWDQAVADFPSFSELWKRADDKNIKVWMPEVPPYSAPTPKLERPEMKEFVKERIWTYGFGNPETFRAHGENGILVKAGKANGTLTFHHTSWVQIAGGEDKEVLFGSAEGASLGNAPATLNVVIRVGGNEVFRKKWEKDLLKLEDTAKLFEQKAHVDFRFAIGPLPMKAEVGFRGTAGVKYGVQIVPLAGTAYATPFLSLDGYAQLAIDLGIAGGGIGGELTIIRDEVPLKAMVNILVGDQPELQVMLDGRNEMSCLSGRLYAFVYVNFFLFKWEPKPFDIFTWEGFKSSASLFHLDWKWSPNGVVASGDLTADDVTEIKETNAELRAVAMQNKANALEHDVLTAISDDLTSPKATAPAQVDGQMKVLATGLDNVIKSYWAELRRWIQS